MRFSPVLWFPILNPPDVGGEKGCVVFTVGAWPNDGVEAPNPLDPAPKEDVEPPKLEGAGVEPNPADAGVGPNPEDGAPNPGEGAPKPDDGAALVPNP